jgi:FtsH-binding integral membrane protein
MSYDPKQNAPLRGESIDDSSEVSGLTAPPGGMHAFTDQFVRKGFIRKVYGILTVQLAVTFGMIFIVVFAMPATFCGQGNVCNAGECTTGGCIAPTSAIQTTMILSIVLSFVFLCAITCCINNARTYPTNYILLGGFTLCEAVMLSCVCLFMSTAAVGLAAAMTFLVTGGLTAYACTTTTDFTGMGPYLFAALLSLLVRTCVILVQWQ